LLQVRLRPATPEEAVAVATIARAAYTPYVARIGREPAPMVADFPSHIADNHVTVAECQGQVVGYVVAFCHDGPLGQLENIAVDPSHHGRGIGYALITHVEEKARNAGCSHVTLYTNVAMTENLTLYPRLGYTETERRTEDGFHRVYFAKPL